MASNIILIVKHLPQFIPGRVIVGIATLNNTVLPLLSVAVLQVATTESCLDIALCVDKALGRAAAA
jgi:hypothetical protein